MQTTTLRFRAMGTPCEIQLYRGGMVDAEKVATMAAGEVERLERKYSRYRDDSVAARINRSAGNPEGVVVDDETTALLDFAETAHRESEGLFDITSGVLREVWHRDRIRTPSTEELEAVRARVGWHQVRWEAPRLVLPLVGMQIDFGGYVKEYAADRAAALCRRLGARHGVVDLGGDLSLVGPHPDGSPWRVGIRDPFRPGASIAGVEVASGAIASSGDYERFLQLDGRRYGHILDPRTGWPVEGLTHVSVVARHCLVAGLASTVALLKGERGGVRWLESLDLSHLWVTRNGAMGGTLGSLSAGSAALV